MLCDALDIDQLLNADSFLIKKVITPLLEEVIGIGATEFSDSVSDYMIMAKNANYEQGAGRSLEGNLTWNYEQTQKQMLIDTALKLVEKDVDKLSGLVFPIKAYK